MRRLGRSLFVLAIAAAMLSTAAPALAHDHRAPQSEKKKVEIGPLQAPSAGALFARVQISGATPGHPALVPFSGELTNLPIDPNVTYPSPTGPCDAAACRELQVDVPAGMKTLYGTIRWNQPSYYLHLYAISPPSNGTRQIHGRVGNSLNTNVFGYSFEDEAASFDKEIGNERTITRSQFTIPNPRPGTWIIRAMSVFSNKTRFDGAVAVSADPPLEFKRLNVLEMGDRFGTQKLRVNVVFLGREWTKDEVAKMREQMPEEYRAPVLAKAFADCDDGDIPGLGSQGIGFPGRKDDTVDCGGGTLVQWRQVHYSGTRTTKGDRVGDAGGYVPYFEPLRFLYDYRFYQASDRYTRDLFGYMASITKKDEPLALTGGTRPGQGAFLASYNATRGLFRGADALVPDATIADKIDPYPVEDWIFSHRSDPRYADAFHDVESGKARDGRFITPDPGAYLDPWYTAKGKRDLDRIPQGSAVSMTMFIADTFSTPLAREHFRPEVYHAFDVSQHMIDPDTDEPDGPDWMRMWGGRYRFFFLDLGAMPNSWESTDWSGRTPTDSATWPDGDPPVWEMLNNPQWDGETTLIDKTSRNIRTMIFHRFTAGYLYRPIPADVYFVANNTWSDYYSRPAPEGGGGISYSDLTRLYDADWVERNLASALPGVTFVTERGDPALQTFRYLGCPSVRAGTAPTVTGAANENAGGFVGAPTVPYPPALMIPNPTCSEPDKFQEALEYAKAQGDDVAGAGVNGQVVVSAGVVRRFVEENRAEIAPLRPNQLTVTNISVVFPGAMTWTLPAIVGGIAFGTPNDEAWGVLQNVNDRFKAAGATDCDKSPLAPECVGAPIPTQDPGSGFSYTIEHEATHFVGLLHPHDGLGVEKDEEGKWRYYYDELVWLPDLAQAPTTYAGAFAPYSVIDQDIIQRGHYAEYLRMAQDWIADAYLEDALKGLASPSAATLKRRAEMERWRALGASLLARGDYLHAEYAARNAFLASQGTFGPLVEPRRLKPGEKVLFRIAPQASYALDGPITPGPLVGGIKVTPRGKPLPATGVGDALYIGVLFMATAAGMVRWRRRTG